MRAFVLTLLCAWASAVFAADGGHAGHGSSTSDGQTSGAPAGWTDLPLIEAMPGRDRSKATFRSSNLIVDAIKVFAPGSRAPLPDGVRFKSDRQEWDIPAREDRFALQSAGVGNYHWLQAREETPESVKVASTAHYFSNPGPAPTAMLARPKSELEIVPDPLPREHNQYRENQEWAFTLRFRDQPLAGATLLFASSAGSRTSFVSDAAGRALVRFPTDVAPDERQGHHGGGASNRFVLAVEHRADDRHYLTAFNYRYDEDAYARRSLVWGGGFLALGGLLGLPLIVRRKENRRA
jgi:hypothetical protein